MKKLNNINFSHKSIIIIFFVIIGIFLTSAFFEYNSRRNSVITLMSHMSRNLANSIETASVNAILNYDKIEEETALRMINSLKMVQHLDVENTMNPKDFARFAKEHNLYKILILDSIDVVTLLPFIEPGYTEYWGFHFVPAEPTEKFIAALKSESGKYYIAMIETEKLTTLQQENGITPLINNIVADSSIKYIAIQDTLGIIAASENIQSLSSIYGDEFLQKSLEESIFQYRKFMFEDELVYESVAPFQVLDVSYGLIRIGIDYQPIDDLNRTAIRNTIIRMGLSAMMLLMLFAYSLIVQKLVIINQEKEKITAEVYRLQEDIRRKEKLTAMGELAAGVAHEIRNPLNAISMSVQRLGKSLNLEQDSKESKLIRTIRNEISRVGEIIHQFLNFARPAPLNKSQSNLNDLIKNILDIYQAKIEEKQIEVHWESGKIPKIFSDQEKIKQVIINLLENAVNAIDKAGEIAISTKYEAGEIKLKIRDNGIGIPKENLDKIFNLYFTTRPEGNGLGLAEVAQIIANHNGKIDVQSEKNKFTEFTITLPKE